jgi:hypothetical protein
MPPKTPGSSAKKRKVIDNSGNPPSAKQVKETLVEVEKLKKHVEDKHKNPKQTLSDFREKYPDAKEVCEKSNELVIKEIERIAVNAVQSIMKGEGFGYTVPTRSAANQTYIQVRVAGGTVLIIYFSIMRLRVAASGVALPTD